MNFARTRDARLLLAAMAVQLLAGCGNDKGAGAPGPLPDGGGGGDAGADTAPASEGGSPGAETGGALTIAGTIKDKAGVVVVGARVEVPGAAGMPIFSDAQGKYAAPAPMAGPTTVKVTRGWFAPAQSDVVVQANGITPLDVTLEELPLKIEAADRALAETHAMTFDWTKSTISIAVIPRPTRRDFDNGVYWRNPALYRDTSKDTPFDPVPKPGFVAGAPANFSFTIKSAGPSMGREVLDVATIADAIGTTGLGATEPAEFMLWTPMMNWLTQWDATKVADLRAVGVAINQQNWGGNLQQPQTADKVFIAANGDLWVKVIFASFVKLDDTIKDDDGDGAKEIYARIAKTQYTAEITDKLTNDYGKTLFNAHGLSKEVIKALNELYSKTAAMVERTLGQPFEVPGLGTITYPTLVLKHSQGQRNVLLVAPGP